MTDAGLPTPDLAAGDCVHKRTHRSTGGLMLARSCSECIRLALSRARDEGIEAAAQVAHYQITCSWCSMPERERGSNWKCFCLDERARVAAAIRTLKEDRQR